MDTIELGQLTALLAADPQAGLEKWRTLYFSELDRRQHQHCKTLLSLLAGDQHPMLQVANKHYSAVLLLEQHQYDLAEKILRELLAGALSQEQRARSLLELAILLDEQGEWPEAVNYYRQAEQAYIECNNNGGRAKVLNNLAISLCYQVEQGAANEATLAEALALHEQAQRLAGSVDAHSWEVAKEWHGIGKVYGRQAEYHKAESAFQTYLELAVEHGNEHVRGYTLTDLALLVYLPQGRLDAAASAIASAIPILQAHDDLLNLAEACMVRGHILMRQGDETAALASYEEAIAATESIRNRLTAPTAKISSRATTEAIYRAPLALHLTRKDAVAAFTSAERARGRVLADLLARQSARPHVALPKGLLAKRRRIGQALDQAYAASQEDASTVLRRTIETQERLLSDLDHQIERLDRAYASLGTLAPLDTAAVQERLPSGAALLTWVAGAEDRIWMIVVTRGDVQLAPAPPGIKLRWLQGHLADYLDGTRRGSLTPDPETSALAPLRLYPDLYRALVAPVEPLLSGVHTLYIVPAGPLHHVPMGALTAGEGEAPWSNGRRVVYAPSATVLLDYCHQRPASPQTGILAMAPADAHLRLIQPAAHYIAKVGGGTALVGDTATRRALLRQARNYRVLCFLGHSWFDRRYPMSSRLQLADGSMHASEILRSLRLQTDLTILAACETGRGQVPRGDEILGLSRALLYAGTPSLLVTLWRVHEAPTRLLVERLIESLPLDKGRHEPLDTAAALAEAQNWLRTLTLAEARSRMAAWADLAPPEVDVLLTRLWQMTAPGKIPQAGSRLFAHAFFWSPYVLIGDRPAGLTWGG